MPFWLFALVIAALIPISGAVSAACLYITGLLFRTRALNFRRCLGAVAVVLAIQLAITLVLIEFVPRNIRNEAISALAMIVVQFIVIWRAARARIPRSLAIGLVSFAMMAAAAFAEKALLNATLLEAYVIPTGSMAPTLATGDRFLVDHTLKPRRWDIVTFCPPGEDTVWAKRLIGLPGETVEIKNGKVHINGTPIEAPAGTPAIAYQSRAPYPGMYPSPLNGCEGNPITLGPRECFVLGDNTEASLDSRYWTTPARPGMQPGALPFDDIKGVARCIYGPAPRARIFR